MSHKTWISWSSGKDSAFALNELRKQGQYEITGLLTTVNETFERVAMHSVRETLLIRQAEELGLPLHRIKIPHPCSNEIYEKQMHKAILEAKKQGVTHMMFGDLFLEDIRQYRERMLEPNGITPIFPIWQRPTNVLAQEMIASGFKAVVTCIDPKQLPASFAGRRFDQTFLNDLPKEVDPCGERGEFHTFVYAGPVFQNPINIKVGEIIEREGFIFTDINSVEDEKSNKMGHRNDIS
jgi:uncharacterized protein (TIGR00290 family)